MAEFVDTDRCGREILEQLHAIATADVTDVVGISDGALTVRSTAELTDQQKAAIASIEKSTGGLRVKFYDKLKALELLGKCVGVFERPPASPQGNALLRAIEESTGREMDFGQLQALQQAPAAGADLVESAGISGL